MQLNKNIKIFLNFIVGPLLFIWLSYGLYRQVSQQPHLSASWEHLKASWGSRKIIILTITVLLMLVNWGLEAMKWKNAVKDVHRFSFLQAFRAVLSGVSVSVVMPNRVGEYFGRIMYMPEGKRLRVVSVAMVCGLSQLLITFIAGLAGLIALRTELLRADFFNEIAYGWMVGILSAVGFVLTVFYFNVGFFQKLTESRFRKFSWFYLVEVLHEFSMQRLGYLLGLSFARYIVFVLQYILVFSLFDVNVSPVILLWIMTLVFLSLAVIPTITLAEIGWRGELTLKLVGLFSTNSLGIVLATVVVWVINLILPALAGTVLMLRVKLFGTQALNREKR
jgi:hypothetical protein